MCERCEYALAAVDTLLSELAPACVDALSTRLVAMARAHLPGLEAYPDAGSTDALMGLVRTMVGMEKEIARLQDFAASLQAEREETP